MTGPHLFNIQSVLPLTLVTEILPGSLSLLSIGWFWFAILIKVPLKLKIQYFQYQKQLQNRFNCHEIMHFWSND